MPSSRPLRRLLVVLALLGGVTLVPSPSASSSGSTDLSASDRGTGPTIPVVATAQGTDDITWSDVPKDHWARVAIDHVGAANDWMRDYKQADDGTYPFKPDAAATRKHLARAVFRAFAPDEAADPAIAFTDLATDDKFFEAANVAVKLGWMTADGGSFLPDDPVTTTVAHRVLVLALGLVEEAAGLDSLHTKNGHTFETPPDFGTLLLGIRLGLRYNHGDEALDVGPATQLTRAEVAWSLYRASTAPSWTIGGLAPYASIELPTLGPKKRQIVQFGVGYVGYPYVYAGEWHEPTPAGYCCGTQPVGGFDCSGLTWWAMKAATTSWDNTPPRTYEGWPLLERSSRDMASVGEKIKFDDIRSGDLLFYDGNDDGTVDHVNVYLGNGWALDSSSGAGGVSILKVDAGWYFDHFVHARRIIG